MLGVAKSLERKRLRRNFTSISLFRLAFALKGCWCSNINLIISLLIQKKKTILKFAQKMLKSGLFYQMLRSLHVSELFILVKVGRMPVEQSGGQKRINWLLTLPMCPWQAFNPKTCFKHEIYSAFHTFCQLKHYVGYKHTISMANLLFAEKISFSLT